MAETLTTLNTRRSCRAYKPELIEEEKLNAIIEVGTYAATGMGKQSPIIVVVTDRELRDRLAKMNAAIMGMDIGHLILGYAAKPVAEAAPRKADYVYRV